MPADTQQICCAGRADAWPQGLPLPNHRWRRNTDDEKNGIYEEGILEKQVVSVPRIFGVTECPLDSKRFLVGAAGLEPATLCLEGRVSALLTIYLARQGKRMSSQVRREGRRDRRHPPVDSSKPRIRNHSSTRAPARIDSRIPSS